MTTHTVYRIDTAGLLMGTVQASESPKQPGTVLLPAGTVQVPPPAEVPTGMQPRWTGSDWVLTPLQVQRHHTL